MRLSSLSAATVAVACFTFLSNDALACVDFDGDGACSVATGGTDCDDMDSHIHVGVMELCEPPGVDDDCDTLIDDADPGTVMQPTFYADADGDGFGDGAMSATRCVPDTTHVVTNGLDCDDTSSAIKPTATEVCDADDVDEDCNGAAEDADVAATGKTLFYEDVDNDGYGNVTSSRMRCDASATYDVPVALDCDDAHGSVNPEELERCNTRDDDCDGATDEDEVCASGTPDASVGDDAGTTGTMTGGGGCNASGGSPSFGVIGLLLTACAVVLRRRA